MKRRRSRDWLIVCIVLLAGGMGITLFALAQSYEEDDNYSQIEEGLWMGGDVQKPPRGTRAVLNLWEGPDPYECKVHRWEPTRDAAPAPSRKWLFEMVLFVRENRGKGLQTYVHCRNGVSRSGMVVTAYLMKKHNWTRDDALAYVRTKRPIVRPNKAFMELLLEWEQALKAMRELETREGGIRDWVPPFKRE